MKQYILKASELDGYLTGEEKKTIVSMNIIYDDAVKVFKTLEKSEELYPYEHLPFNGFFLAMAHWQLGHQDQARGWYDKAVAMVEKKRPNREEELLRMRTETEELMGIEKEVQANEQP